jgi:hypothetical protein
MTRCRAVLLVIALGLATAVGPGCRPARRATSVDCLQIFDRLVELEMDERGFRDEVAVIRTKERLRHELTTSIASCEGRPLSDNALACVRRAHRAEEITHVCLE